MSLQFLEVHEPVEAVADVAGEEPLIRHAIANCLIDVITHAHAERAVAEARIHGSSIFKCSLPLGRAGDARFLQRCDLGSLAVHVNMFADKTTN